ncbi:MAG: hypothetical protein WAT78_06620 [Rhizobiaceae bacterium]
MSVKAHDAPWGMVVSLVPKSVVDYFQQAALKGEVGVPVPPAEQAAILARLKAIGFNLPPGADMSKYGVTGYELFLPAFEEYAQYFSNNPQPDTQANIAKLARDYQAGKASGNYSDEYYAANDVVQSIARNGRSAGTAWTHDYTLWGTTGTVCDILIVNGLDEPLTVADPFIGHGYPIYFPQVMTPIDHGDPVAASTNVIPGRTCMPDGTNRFGLGLFRFQKGDGALYGTEGAMQLTTSDPAAPQPIGIAWGLDYGNSPSMAATADLSQYNSLQAFYEATTKVSKSTYGEGKFGVNINCYIDYTSSQPPGKDDGHRVLTVVIQPTGGVKETNADPVAGASSPLPAMLKNLAAALPAPQAAPAPPFIGQVNKPGIGNPNHLPPNVVPFVNDDD